METHFKRKQFILAHGGGSRRRTWQPAVGLCQETALSLQVSWVQGTFRKPCWHRSSAKVQVEILWKRGAVLLVHKCRTMENNLIAFEVDCLLEICFKCFV